MDIEILFKKQDDTSKLRIFKSEFLVWPAVFALDGDFFSFINPQTDKPLDPKKYLYTDIVAVIMRSRPEHCDIKSFLIFVGFLIFIG